MPIAMTLPMFAPNWPRRLAGWKSSPRRVVKTGLFQTNRQWSVFHRGPCSVFRDRGNALLFQGHGWNAGEAWGTWTEGNQATLNISFSEPFQDGCFMRVLAKA